MEATLQNTAMEITTTIQEAPSIIQELHIPPNTTIHIVIDEPLEKRKDTLLDKIMSFRPIEVGDKDIVETIREEREKLNIR